MAVSVGDKVKVEYEGRFEDGTVSDASSRHGQPLEFNAGEGMVVPGFDNAVIGMNVGQEKTVRLSPEEGYGPSNPAAIQKVPRDKFPKNAMEGMEVGIPLPDGNVYPAVITKIDNSFVTLDMNHPMAGKVLIFKIKVVEIEK